MRLSVLENPDKDAAYRMNDFYLPFLICNVKKSIRCNSLSMVKDIEICCISTRTLNNILQLAIEKSSDENMMRSLLI